MLRFLLDVWCRCGADVSAMDTRAPPDLRYQPTIASKTDQLRPGIAPEWASRSLGAYMSQK